MALFTKTKVVLWPRNKVTEFYFDRKENNYFSFDVSLWQSKDEAAVAALRQFIKDNGITEITLLLPDDVVHTKSFVYDSKITSIEKSEVAQLAQGFVNFQIDPNALEFTLSDKEDKTIIRSLIFDKQKIDVLNTNLGILGLKVTSQTPISAAISKVISTFYQDQYFFIYPLEDNQSVFSLSKSDSVYLTNILKGNSFDIQKTINYSNLYFQTPTSKLFLPLNASYEINSTTKLEKTPFDEHQLAGNLSKPNNLPLPVVGAIMSTTVLASAPKTDIINPVTPINPPKIMEENKKNIFPIIAVFVLTAGIASVIFWYVVNRNQADQLESPAGDITPIAEAQPTTPPETPTPAASPTPANVSKNIKIQVLNATEINGQAATLKAQLTKLGFKNVAVGNSPDKLTSNEVKTKATASDYVGYFQSSLGDYFPATYTSDLKDASSYDVVFYIGTDLSQAPSPPAVNSSSSSSAAEDVSPSPTKSAKTTTVTPTTKAGTTVTPTKKVTATPTTAN